ncbi:MAG: MaoC family dehydratase, partial [Candidatus Cloacimonetes bacterium]|nr:MaoC family dehydratase [Candidatus Cloacimonadota bacterium]
CKYCETEIYGKPLVVGTLVFSLVVGMTVSEISGKAIANLDYEKITHDGPVFIGDTIHAKTEILEVRESKSKPDRGIIFVETRAFNQNNEKVLTFRRHVLIPKR